MGSSNALDAAGNDPSVFEMFTADWLNLQSFCASITILPKTLEEWKTTYGETTTMTKGKLDAVLAQIKILKDLSGTFGDPTSLKRNILSDPRYLTSGAPPVEIYGNIVWLAHQISSTASMFKFTMKALNQMLDPTLEPSAQKRAENLREILVGPGGLQSCAKAMYDQTRLLKNKLLTFDGNCTEVETALKPYLAPTGANSLVSEVSGLLSGIDDDITTLTASSTAAYNQWLAYTISASVSSVTVLVLSFGWLLPVAAALGGGLGAAAAVARKNYEKLCSQLKDAGVEKTKKTQLITDLTGLNTQLGDVSTSIGKFHTSLERVEGVWLGVELSLDDIVRNCTVEQLSNYQSMRQVFAILGAQDEWASIADMSKAFTLNSMVSYRNDLRIGQRLPAA